MIAKDDTWRTLLPDLPRIALYEVLALGYAVLRERELLPGYLDAARRWGRVRAKRGEAGALHRPPFGLEPPRT